MTAYQKGIKMKVLKAMAPCEKHNSCEQNCDNDGNQKENKMECATEEGYQNEMADPNSVSLDVVFGMFQKLQLDMDELKKQNNQARITEAQQEIQKHGEQLTGITFDQLQQSERLNRITADLDLFKTRTEIMAGVIQRMDVIMQEQSDKLERIEQDKAKCSVLIRNLYSGPLITDAKLEVYRLLYQHMQVDVTVIDIFLSGSISTEANCCHISKC